MTYYRLFKEKIQSNEDKTAIIYKEVSYSFDEVLCLVEKIASELSDKGIKQGEKVGIIIHDKLDTLLSIVAINCIGAISVPIYPKTGNIKIKKMIENYELKYILVDSILADILSEMYLRIFEMSELKKTILIRTNLNVTSSSNLHDDVAMIISTSGTTGRPKGIMLTNKNILSNIGAVSAYLQICENDVVLHIKHMYHSSSIISEALLSLLCGNVLVLADTIVTPRNIVKYINLYKVTFFFAVPIILQELLCYAMRHNEHLTSVKTINFYGAPIDNRLLEDLLGYFQEINFIYSYGLTEASPRVTYANRSLLEKKKGTVGKAINNVQVHVLREGQEECCANEIGEIVVKGPGVMKGYYKNETMTSRTIANSMLFTGDLGYKDGDGDLFIVGRKDNMFVYAGKNVYPEEIEKVLMDMGIFSGAYVRKEQGEHIYAYVETCCEAFDMKKILAYCRMNLEDYKIPYRIIPVEKLSWTPNGKIIRDTI